MKHSREQRRKQTVLVELSMSGDAVAFDRLYRFWHPRWFRFCTRLVGNTQDASDVMQEAALHIATHIVRLREAGLFVPWAYTIIRRRAADHIRSNQRRRKLSHELQTEAAADPRATAPVEPDDDLAQALSTLSDEQINLVSLFYAYGLSVNELATVLGLPTGTVKSRLYTARQTLKEFLNTEQENTHE